MSPVKDMIMSDNWLKFRNKVGVKVEPEQKKWKEKCQV